MNENSASDTLRQHAAKGRKIHSDLLMARQSKLRAGRDVAAGVDALDLFFDLSGKKRLAKVLGGRYLHSVANDRISELNRTADEWISEAKSILREISVQRKGIPTKPNSDALVNSLIAQMRYSLPETRLSHGITYLEKLADSRLILNDEISQMKIPFEKESRLFLSKTENAVRVSEANGIEAGLSSLKELSSSFPAVTLALDGAASVCRQRNPDWGRQAVGSMRNALETLVRGLSGEGNWRAGLEKLVPSESARKPIVVTYSMLCAKGPHSSEIPTEEDVLFCIRLTQEEIKYILKCVGRGAG